MRLNNCFVIIIACCALTLEVIAADVPFLRESRSKTVLPSIFLIEDQDGASAHFAEWINTTAKQYYADSVSLLKKEIADRKMNGVEANQFEHTLSLFESEAKCGLLPRWVENVFVVCKGTEVIVSFFPRSGGWVESNTGALASNNNPAYISTINQKTGKIESVKNNFKAVVYANLYEALASEGIKTNYTQGPSLTTPLNADSKVSRTPQGE